MSVTLVHAGELFSPLQHLRDLIPQVGVEQMH